jgi:formate dehydrogenase maturation protein FdhE
MKTKIFCPFCDGQGLIDKASIVGKGTPIYICEECDTMWKTIEIREDNCENFKKFMQSIGLKGKWSELTNVERL